jgi:hypothetical protein
MKKTFLLMLFACLLVIPVKASVRAITTNDLIGKWTNQLGSTLNIAALDPKTGQITGTYMSPSGTTGNEYPIVGWANYSQPSQKKDNVVVVSFSVRWGEYGSVTTWNGYLKEVNGVLTITAQWLLVRSNSDFAWDHILTNQDVFTPAKKISSFTPRNDKLRAKSIKKVR